MTIATSTDELQVDAQSYLKELQKLVTTLQDDLRERSGELPEVRERLTREYNQARSSERTLDTFESWREDYLTQVAVAWVLSCVFLRYLEDNLLIDGVWLAGEGERLTMAHDRHQLYFQKHPTHTDREYLEEAFRAVAALPDCQELFGEARNPLWLLGPTGDAAKELLGFWQAIDPATGRLKRTFGDPESGKTASTRFLGDLYQDLSESARKRYALLQTPDFVEEFILDRTLDPAIETFGLEEVRMLDPTCGSGHFLLGGFRRLLEQWRRTSPNTNNRELVRRALDGVYGVDLNPFAVAIARFRLLVAALRACGIRRLKDAPAFGIHVATGDSLLHGCRFERGQGLLSVEQDWLPDPFAQGDFREATEILSQQYHVVVGNPPYIADKNRAHKEAVRKRYASCHGKFVLAVPFKEVFFEKALAGSVAGYVGMITANNFMKREFGTKLIEEFFPTIDLTHVIDTSGAYLPGHGTPTVILLGRSQMPRSNVVRAALGVRGEPTTPDDPADGKVWRSIVDLIDLPGEENDFITIADVERETLHSHPWSLSGGGASDLKELIEGSAQSRAGDIVDSIGITSFTLEDDAFLMPEAAARRKGIAPRHIRPMVTGDAIRDWSIGSLEVAVFPYTDDFEPIEEDRGRSALRCLAPYRTNLSNNRMFGAKTKIEAGLRWYEFGRLTSDKLKTPLSITFAFVATHNHFVLDRGGKVFNRTAPVIKLPEGSSEEEHLALLGLLNSSVGNFWIRQVGFSKGGDHVGTQGARVIKRPWDDRLERDGTKLQQFPLPSGYAQCLLYSKELDACGAARQLLLAEATYGPSLSGERLESARALEEELYEHSVAVQEELDWFNYGLYGVYPSDGLPLYDIADVPRIRPGERAFEIVMARRLAEGEEDAVWFERHNIAPRTELPSHWPAGYKAVVRKRIELIGKDRAIRLLEDPMCKNRWQRVAWDVRAREALEVRLLDDIEAGISHDAVQLTTPARLADALSRNPDFLQVAELYAGRDDFDLTELVTDLVMSQDVPYLSAFRYKPSGLRKRAQWERTWELQRQEDAGEEVGKIPVPPKYGSGDFKKSHYWSLRGKLDVPKERFISYPLAERDTDPTPVIGWAGWDHLQQAQALASYYLERKDQDGWEAERLQPLLAGLLELIPWLKQWYNDIDPEMQVRLGDFYEGFLTEQARSLGLTLQDLREWRPQAKAGRGRRKKS